MFNWLKKLFSNANDKKINSLKIKVEHINSLEAQMISLSDSELREQTNILRKKIIQKLAVEWMQSLKNNTERRYNFFSFCSC